MTKSATVEEVKQSIIDKEDREVKRHIDFINNNLSKGVFRPITTSNIRVYRRVKKEFISRGFAAERTRGFDTLSLSVSLKEDNRLDGLLYLLGVLLFMCIIVLLAVLIK